LIFGLHARRRVENQPRHIENQAKHEDERQKDAEPSAQG
jgi:hypothetical protein